MNPKLKEKFKKQCIQQIDEINNIKLKLNKDTESGTKQKIASKENQDDIKRLNEIRKLPETRAGKKNSKLSYLNEVCTTIKTSKEECNKQLLEQREENQTLNIKLKTEIDSGTKIRILDKEHQGDITRVKKSETRSKGIEAEKERIISCSKEDIKECEISKVEYGKQLILKRQEINESFNKLNLI